MKKIEVDSGIRNFWWLPLISGLVCLGLGIWTLCVPVEAITFLSYVFAVCLVLTGVLNCCYAGATARYTPGWGWALAMGIIELVCGVWLLCLPAAAVASTFVFVMGFFIFVAVINSLCEAFTLSYFSGWWVVWSILLLVATVVLAGTFLSNPIAGGVVVWLWLGLSLIFFGVFRVSLAFAVRSATRP